MKQRVNYSTKIKVDQDGQQNYLEKILLRCPHACFSTPETMWGFLMDWLDKASIILKSPVKIQGVLLEKVLKILCHSRVHPP